MKKSRSGLFLYAALILAVVLTVGCAGLPGLPGSRARQLVAEGDRLAAAGRPAEAILAYRQAASQDGQNVEALQKLAAAYAGQGRARLAGRYYERAQALRPEDPALIAGQEAAQAAAWATGPGALRLDWEKLAGDSVPVGLAALKDMVYTALEGGELVALAADDGATLWKTRLPSHATSEIGLGEGMVLVGSEDGVLWALDAGDGHERWHFATKAPIYAAAMVDAGTVYCAGGDGTLYALSARDGTSRWKFDSGAALRAAPGLAGGVLYFGSSDGRVYAVDAATGAPRWGAGQPTQGAVESRPVVADGRVLVGSGDARLYALAADHGGEYWRYGTPDAIYATPLVAGDTVYLASNGQTLTALDLLTGEARWEVEAPAPLAYTPALAGETLYYVATADPHLYAVDRTTGQLLGQTPLGDWPGSSPAVIGGRLFLATKDGTILAFDL